MHAYYVPDEDTFLLEDALRLSFSGSKPKGVVVEVGCGSGYISKVLREICPESYVLSTDINPDAVSASQACLDLSCTNNGDVIRTSIIDGISLGKIDVCVFNPPYLPSSAEDLQGHGIDRAWAGGVSGAEIISQFLRETRGVPVRYLLLNACNEPFFIIQTLEKDHAVTTVAARKVPGESLMVIRIEKRRG